MNGRINGTYGAKRQSQREANPYGYVREMLDDHPQMAESDLCKKSNANIRAAIACGDWEMFDAMHEYWFSNCRTNITRPSRTRRTYEEAQEERTEVARRNKEEIAPLIVVAKERMRRMVLMEMIGENGKAFGDMTKADGAKSIGWRSKVFAKLNGKQTVREAFSEDDLWKLIK